MTFVRTSNPQDEAFVVNFNDEYYLDTDGDSPAIRKTWITLYTHRYPRQHGSLRCRDRLLNHVKMGHKDKRVLLVITDGDDDASRKTLADTMKAAETSQRDHLRDWHLQRR